MLRTATIAREQRRREEADAAGAAQARHDDAARLDRWQKLIAALAELVSGERAAFMAPAGELQP